MPLAGSYFPKTMQDIETRTYKGALTVRGDCLYCPMPLSIDSYWNCLIDCHHCGFRRLNRTWGQDLRPADPDEIRRKMESGLKAKNPRSSLYCALSQKKTVRIGSKVDPFQDVELQHKVTHRIVQHLIDMDWTFVIQTRLPANLESGSEDLLIEAGKRGLPTIVCIITPGAEWDWEVLERKRTTPIEERLRILKKWKKLGINLGANGESFIPGLHKVSQFRDMCKRLKSAGITTYNTYNLHLNDYVAKRFHSIGLDIEKIWFMNQDAQWKPILRQLCDIAGEEHISLSCPDWVNVAPGWREPANTCCGVNVPNPSTFNAHIWRLKIQNGSTPEEVLEGTWEGIGDFELGRKVMYGEECGFYTMFDAGMVPKGLLPNNKDNPKTGFGLL